MNHISLAGLTSPARTSTRRWACQPSLRRRRKESRFTGPTALWDPSSAPGFFPPPGRGEGGRGGGLDLHPPRISFGHRSYNSIRRRRSRLPSLLQRHQAKAVAITIAPTAASGEGGSRLASLLQQRQAKAVAIAIAPTAASGEGGRDCHRSYSGIGRRRVATCVAPTTASGEGGSRLASLLQQRQAKAGRDLRRSYNSIRRRRVATCVAPTTASGGCRQQAGSYLRISYIR